MIRKSSLTYVTRKKSVTMNNDGGGYYCWKKRKFKFFLKNQIFRWKQKRRLQWCCWWFIHACNWWNIFFKLVHLSSTNRLTEKKNYFIISCKLQNQFRLNQITHHLYYERKWVLETKRNKKSVIIVIILFNKKKSLTMDAGRNAKLSFCLFFPILLLHYIHFFFAFEKNSLKLKQQKKMEKKSSRVKLFIH